eukprot:gene11367-36028_t
MGKHLVVLSVDDDPAQQGIIELVLPPAGFKVVTCMDGESALALLSDEANIPDAILLDVNMPGMSGYEVCRKLRHLSYLAYTPILMVSANSDEGHIVEGLSAENGDADGRICVRNLESDTKTGRLLSNSNSTSTLFSLPRSVKSELEKSTGANKTVRPYEHLSMVMIGISNLDVVVQHLSPGGIASALTSMYIYLDELLGIIMGCNHPVLHFTGSLPSHAAQLQATCPPGCIQVSQALCRALGGDSGKFVAVSSSKSHSTFFRKLGNYHSRALMNSHPGLLVNLLAGVTAPAPLFRTASTSAPSVADFLNMLDSDLTHKSDDPGAPRDSPQEYQVAKVQYEKEELQKQLEEVSQETCRLQELVAGRGQETNASLAESKVAKSEKQLLLTDS